jgi:hypothetical protein
MTAELGVGDYGWKGFMRRHWRAGAIFTVACVVIFAAAVYVFWWFTGNAQSTGLVPSSLSLWTMGNLVGFILYSILWELLLIGIPVAIGAVIAWAWWRRLPEEERRGYHWGKRARNTGGSGGFGLFLFILFAIKVWLDGNWNAAIATFTLNYVVGSVITILVWLAVIFGIPGAIIVIWWIRHELRKP